MAKFRTDDLPDIKANPGAFSQVLAQKLDHMFTHLSMENFAQNAWSETPLASSILIADENGLYNGKTVEQALQEAAESNAKKQAALTFDTTPTDGSSNPVTSGGLFTSFAKKQDVTDNLTQIIQYTLTAPGNRFGVIPFVQTDGGMEVGGYIDFHNSDTETSDFVQRILNSSEGFILGATSSGGSKGVVGKVTRTAGAFGRNGSMYGQCFCTCLGNGNFRFDISGKWYVGSAITNHDYGISKDFLKQAVYNNIYSSTSGSINLTFVSIGELLVSSATDYTYGHPNQGYGWAVQEQTYSFSVARIYDTSGSVGGWEGNIVNSSFPEGFYFKATIFAKMA